MERDEYISRIRKLLHDPEGKAWDDEELNAMLDYAVKCFCLDTAAFRGDFRFYADENGQCKQIGEGTHIESASADYLSRRYGNYSAVNGQPQFICEDLNTIGMARLVPNPHALQNGEKLIGVSSYGIPYRINHPDDPDPIPLTLTAVETSTVTLNATGSPTVAGLHYRLGTSGMWLPYTIGDTINLAAGESVQFWNSAETLSLSASSYVRFDMTGKIEGSGSVQSLFAFSKSCPAYGLYSVFYNSLSLITAPEFPALTVGASAYYSALRGTSITESPRLPALSIGVNCYRAMFRDCKQMTILHEISAPALADSCCYDICVSCTKLTSAKLAATSLATSCLDSAFYGCTALASVEVAFTEWLFVATRIWLSGVAGSGIFIKPAVLEVTRGASNIPNGWTVVDK